MTIRTDKRTVSLLSMAFFTLVILASIADIIADLNQGAKTGHILQEAFIVLIALLLLGLLYHNFRLEQQKNKTLLLDIAEARKLSARASQELLNAKKAFGEEIQKQFSAWGFTQSEFDIALLTLKGFNSKEIASLREAAEKTVRNQLSSIYKKAGLSGKHAFISWFMDGLF